GAGLPEGLVTVPERARLHRAGRRVGLRVEEQHDLRLPPEIGEPHRLAGRGGELEIGRGIADAHGDRVGHQALRSGRPLRRTDQRRTSASVETRPSSTSRRRSSARRRNASLVSRRRSMKSGSSVGIGTSSNLGIPPIVTTTGDSWQACAYSSRWAFASLRSITFMGCVLLSSHDEPVTDFLTDDLNTDDSLVLIDIVEHSIIAEPQFPASNGVRTHLLDAARLPRRLVGEVSGKAIDYDSPHIGRHQTQIAFSTF